MPKLVTIDPGTLFKYNGELYAHDLNGKSSGGRIAVINVDTEEKLLVPASTQVELAKEVEYVKIEEEAEVGNEDDTDVVTDEEVEEVEDDDEEEEKENKGRFNWFNPDN